VKFLLRDAMQARPMPPCGVRPSVRPSVRLSVTLVNSGTLTREVTNLPGQVVDDANRHLSLTVLL